MFMVDASLCALASCVQVSISERRNVNVGRRLKRKRTENLTWRSLGEKSGNPIHFVMGWANVYVERPSAVMN